jgi:ATP-dependent Lon protease
MGKRSRPESSSPSCCSFRFSSELWSAVSAAAVAVAVAVALSAQSRGVVEPAARPIYRRNPRHRANFDIVTTSETLPNELPLLALRSTIVFPHGTIAVQVGAPDNVALLTAHPEPGTLVLLAIALGDDAGDLSRLSGRVGVLARVREHSRSAIGTMQVTLEGLSRVRIGVLSQRTPFPIAGLATLDEVANTALSGAEQDALRARMSRIVSAAEALVELNDQFPAEVPGLLRKVAKHPSRFADLAALHGSLRIAEKDEILQCLDAGDRLERLALKFEKEVARAQVLEDVKQQTEVKVEQHHREFYLRQQLQAIRAELGDRDPLESDAQELLKQIEGAGLPANVAQAARALAGVE